MKKQMLAVMLLGAGLMSHAVSAAPSSATLEWRGFVPGAFEGTAIALTGQGGSDIQTGELTFDDTGALSTVRAITVEAHAVDTDDVDPTITTISDELFTGTVNWSISAPNVSHAAYNVADLEFSINGEPLAVGDSYPTETGNHSVGFSVTAPVGDADLLTPGEVVSVTAMVFAEEAAAE